MQVKILKDIVSMGKLKTRYVDKGEVLQVLKDNGNVLIVKGRKENFPVALDNVKIIP